MDIGAIATVISVVVAAVALIAQLRQQSALGRQSKMVQIYLDCTATYARLQEERIELQDVSDTSPRTERLLKRNLVALWDLLASEYEFVIAELLPEEVFERWFDLLHTYLHAEPGELFAKATLKQSWIRDGRPFAGKISPKFAELMDKAILEPQFGLVLVEVKDSLSRNKNKGLFRRLK
jgi:hypothetical protein